MKSSLALWNHMFEHDPLSDMSTIACEEDISTHTEASVQGMPIIQIEKRALAPDHFPAHFEGGLIVKYQIKDATTDARYTGAPKTLAAAQRATFATSAWCMFSNVRLLCNNVEKQNIQNPGYVRDVLGRIEEPESNDARAELDLFYPPQYGGYRNVIDNLDIAGAAYAGATANAYWNGIEVGTAGPYASSTGDVYNTTYDKSFQKRLERTQQQDASGWSYVYLRLSDVLTFLRIKKPLKGVQMQLELTVNSDTNNMFIKAAARNAAKLVIDKVQWVVPVLKPHLDLYTKLQSRLMSEPVPLEYQGVYCQVLKNLTSPLQTNIMSNTKRPRYVIVALMDGVRHTSQNYNSYIYDVPTAINNAQIKIGSQFYPSKFYPSSNDNFLRLYKIFLEASNSLANKRNLSPISFEDWKQTSGFLYFDCSKSNSAYENLNDSQIELNLDITEVNWAAAANKFSAVVLVISDEYYSMQEAQGIATLEKTPAPKFALL